MLKIVLAGHILGTSFLLLKSGDINCTFFTSIKVSHIEPLFGSIVYVCGSTARMLHETCV